MKSEEIMAIEECAKYLKISISIMYRTVQKDKITGIILEEKAKKERRL